MKSLYELQKWVQKNITQDSPISRLECDAYTAETKTLQHQTRWDIYRNAYRIRILEALESDFELLKYLLGEQKFKDLMLKYIQEYPSRYASLAQIGEDVPKFFLHENLQKDYPWAHDFSCFELLLSLVKTCDLEPMFDTDRLELLKVVSPDSLKLVTAQSLHLVHSKYPVGEMYKQKKLMSERESYWAIWSNEFVPYFQEISRAELLALQAAVCEESFSAVLERLSEGGTSETEVGVIFQNWMENGWIKNIQVLNQ